MKITEYILNNKKINDTVSKIIDSSNHHNIYIGNSSANYSKYLAVSTFLKTNKTLVYLASDIYHASSAYDTFLDILGKEFVSFFPGEEFVSQEMVASYIGRHRRPSASPDRSYPFWWYRTCR